MLAYRALVLLDNVEPEMTVKKALAIYRKWHVLNQQAVKYLRASAQVASQRELVVPAAMVPSSDDNFEV
jgi:hypothetical protein